MSRIFERTTTKHALRVVASMTIIGASLGALCAALAPDFYTGAIAFVLILAALWGLLQVVEDLSALDTAEGKNKEDSRW
jgi:uncharacterized membrane protein YfcA